jgi:hypothetical protein
MASPALANNPNTGILRPEINIPVEVALQYTSGKEVEGQYGPQMLFTLTNGQKLYLPLPAADKIDELGLEPHEPFELCKRNIRIGQRNVMQWEVKRIFAPKNTAPLQETPRVPAAAPTASGNVPPRRQGSDSQQTNFPQTTTTHAPQTAGRCGYEEAFTNFLTIALRATTAAEREGAHSGSGVRFDSRDVAAIATSMFIQAGKEGWVSWTPSSVIR